MCRGRASRTARHSAHLCILCAVHPLGSRSVENQINIRLPAQATPQQAALFAELQQLMRLHFFAPPAAFAEGTVVAEDVVQRRAGVEAVLAHREFEANLAEIVERELVTIDDTIVVEVSAREFCVYVDPYSLLSLQRHARTSCAAALHRQYARVPCPTCARRFEQLE